MEKIIVGFSRPKKWMIFSWLIQKGFGTSYSHVYIKIWSEKYKRFLIYQASGTAVNFVGQEHFEQINEVVAEFEFEITDEARTDLMQFAIDQCGVHYGMKQIFGMAMVRIGEILGTKIKNPTQDGKNTFVCSELASYILEEFVGAHLPRLPDDMTPKDVYALVSSLAAQKAA